MRCLSLIVGLLATLAGPSLAQEALADAVKAYFAEVKDEDARPLLDAILARPDATADAVHRILVTRPKPLNGNHRVFIPHADLNLAVEIQAPHQREKGQLFPVLHAINWSSPPLHDAIRGKVVFSETPGYKPPQFGDEGRDAQVKIARTVAFLAGGDPDALWFTGYSWGGHACWDQTLHRPGIARGFIGRGGGPRRTFFRLFPNLRGLRALAVCGGRDDQELVWNLREVRRYAKKSGFEYTFREAPENGHDQPLPGEFESGRDLTLTKPMRSTIAFPRQGKLLIDGPFVAHPLIRITKVDPKRVATPKRIQVRAGAKPDDQRRAVINSMKKAVASASWNIRDKKDTKVLTWSGKGVRTATLFLCAPWFTRDDTVTIKARGKTIYEGPVGADARTMLEEARRTGARLRPVLRRFDVKL